MSIFSGAVNLEVFKKTAGHFHFGSIFRVHICRWGKVEVVKNLKSRNVRRTLVVNDPFGSLNILEVLIMHVDYINAIW